jgi:hypothetical protein
VHSIIESSPCSLLKSQTTSDALHENVSLNLSTVFWTPNIIVLLNKKTTIFTLLKKLSIDGPNGSKYVTVIFPRFCLTVLSPQSPVYRFRNRLGLLWVSGPPIESLHLELSPEEQDVVQPHRRCLVPDICD